MLQQGFAYLVEGQFDVLSLHRYGIENVIGGSGTAFTPDQVKLILRFTQKVVMIYDADAATRGQHPVKLLHSSLAD